VAPGPITAAFLLSPRAGTQLSVAVTIAACLGVAGVWVLVRRGRFSVWASTAWTIGVLAVVAAFTGKVRAATQFRPLVAIAIGLAAGAVLYGATAAFLFVAGRWPPLARQADRVYELRGGLSVPSAAALASLVVAPGEEIVWRGAVQTLLAGVLGPMGGAAAAWGLYVGANAVSRSIPILLGAVAGGAAWVGLAWWTGGVAASAGCHAVWTCLMIVRPPLPRAAR
jgi:membrane protease YdiL (CAAX protease family)